MIVSKQDPVAQTADMRAVYLLLALRSLGLGDLLPCVAIEGCFSQSDAARCDFDHLILAHIGNHLLY